MLGSYTPEYLLDDFPVKPHELLRDRSGRVFKHLVSIAKRHPNEPVWLLDDDGSVEPLTLHQLADKDKNWRINNRTVLLPPAVGGLKEGMLDGESGFANDVADELLDDNGPLRKRVWQDEDAPKGMVLEREIVFKNPDDENEDTGPAKVWRWFARKPESPNEHSRQACELKLHLDQAKDCARKMVEKAGLSKEIADAVVLSSQFHDLGKNRERWQRSIGNDCYPAKVYAKSGTLPDGRTLKSREFFKNYHHEFGLLLDIEQDREFCRQPEDVKELIRHFVAAHHGRARPHFPQDEAFDPEVPLSRWNGVNQEVSRRFVRLQRIVWALGACIPGIATSCRRLGGQRESSRGYRKRSGGLAMSVSKASILVNVDVTNPGQFFACCGLLELADRLWPGAEGWFDDRAFQIAANGSLSNLIRAVSTAELVQLDLDNNTSSAIQINRPFRSLRLDWWQDERAGGKQLKVWAGTMESVRIARAMQQSMRDNRFLSPDLLNVGMIAYDLGNPEKKVEPYYFDARRVPNSHSRDVGFSPNDLQMTTTAFPAVELLCMVGLQGCLPAQTTQSRVYDYFTWGQPMMPELLPPVITGELPLPGTHGYRFENWYRTGQKKHKAFRSAIPLSSGD